MVAIQRGLSACQQGPPLHECKNQIQIANEHCAQSSPRFPCAPASSEHGDVRTVNRSKMTTFKDCLPLATLLKQWQNHETG